MRDFTCCSDVYIDQERTRPINKIVWKTFTAVKLIMHFKSWGYQKSVVVLIPSLSLPPPNII